MISPQDAPHRGPSFTIDVPVPADAPALAAAHVRIWREAYGELLPAAFWDEAASERRMRMWRDTLAGDPVTLRSRVRIARDASGAAAGFCVIGPPRETDPPRPEELRALNGTSDLYGSGAAQSMVSDLLGERPAYLWVADPNPRAQRFYAKLGFQSDGVARTVPELAGLREIRLVR